MASLPNHRTRVLTNHLNVSLPALPPTLTHLPTLGYVPPEGPTEFDTSAMRALLDSHNIADRDRLFGLMRESSLFFPRERKGREFVAPVYNQSMEQQREMTMRRIEYLAKKGVFNEWLTECGPRNELRMLAILEVLGIFDYSLAIKVGVQCLWGGAIQFLGTKHHRDKWLRDTENYKIKGCFAMTELGHGSNVRGIETVATYDPNSEEFVINTPCESAQKYWIGGAANHATHTVIFSQLNINGKNQGIHAFIAQIRDESGNICPNITIADCGHKIGLNGVDNGRIWFNNVRVPRENLLNAVADVTPDGQHLSAIKDPDQRFGAFMAPLTSGRVIIASCAVYASKIGLAIAIRYSLTRRAFSVTPSGPEILLLDYPSHRRRLLPLLAKTYAMSFAVNYLKKIFVKRTPESNKTIYVLSSGLKATLTWHNMRTLQECREACGGQGLKTENRIGHLKGEFDVQLTFEGDNNVLMQQVSKVLLGEYLLAKKRNRTFKGLGLEHMNKPSPIIPSVLSSSTLRSTHFQTDIFCLRERDLLARFAAEVSEHQLAGQTKEIASILSFELAQDLSKAFSERAIFNAIRGAEEALLDGKLKNILGLVRSMYALISIEEDASFLRYGYLSPVQAAEVRNEVNKLCTEMRPHTLALVNSFGIPNAFLGPIAYDWVQANSRSSAL